MSARLFARLLAPLQQRVQMLVARVIVEAVRDTPALQELQVSILAGETREGVEHFQPYGLTSHPQPGAEGVGVFPNGNRDHGLIVVVDDRASRPTGLAVGDVQFYNRAAVTIKLNDDGSLEIDAPGDVTITSGGAASVEASGVCTVEGATVTVTGVATIADGATINAIPFVTHVHPDPVSGNTGPPQ